MIERSTIKINEKEVTKAMKEYLELHVFSKEWLENVEIESIDRVAYSSDAEKQWEITLIKKPTLLGQ